MINNSNIGIQDNFTSVYMNIQYHWTEEQAIVAPGLNPGALRRRLTELMIQHPQMRQAVFC